MAQFEWNEDDLRELVRLIRPRILLANTPWAVAAGMLALAVVRYEPQVGSALFGMSLAWFCSTAAQWWRYPETLRQWLLADGPHANSVKVSESDVTWTVTRVWQRGAIKPKRQGGFWMMERNKHVLSCLPARVLTAEEESLLGR